MKIHVFNALKLVIFEFFKKYFSKFRMLKECTGALVNKIQLINIYDINGLLHLAMPKN